VPTGVLLGLATYGVSSVPFAKVLLGMGASPGAVMAFFLAGHATSVGLLTAMATLVRRRTFILYVATTVAVSLLFGALYRDEALVQEEVHRLDKLLRLRDQLRMAQVLQKLQCVGTAQRLLLPLRVLPLRPALAHTALGGFPGHGPEPVSLPRPVHPSSVGVAVI
jgi:hypothetical protein